MLDRSKRRLAKRLFNQARHPRAIAPRKATRRKFQQYLYDFHSRQVFSFAKNEVEEFEDAMKRDKAEKLLACSARADDEVSED
ncbi:hypothetical protein GQ600_17598 [Phytophthora cactorum]|nr:hypothetical protein GQ600_17598 [Phytophthora cactorum]